MSYSTRKRIPAVRALITFAVAASFLGASIASAAVRPQRGAPAWHARIAISGDFVGLVAAGGTIYAVRDALHGPTSLNSRIVRVNPLTGKIVAQSRILPGADLPVLVDGRLWVAGVTWFSPHATASGPAVLTELDPSTLVRVRQASYANATDVALDGSVDGYLLAQVEPYRSKSCALRWLSPTTGLVVRTAVVARNLGPCAGVAIDSSGQYVYAVVNGPTWHMKIFKLDALTGLIVDRLTEPRAGQNGDDVVATPNRLWIAAGDPGAAGFLLYLSTSPMRLLAETCVDVCSTKGRMPIFGEFPAESFSGGRIWVASQGQLGCFLPSSGRALALVVQNHAPIVSQIVDVDGEIWGTGASVDATSPSGLTRLTPPSACVG